MIIKGQPRGGAKALADHLLKMDTNEAVVMREIEPMITNELNPDAMRVALRQMETFGRARGKSRILYHGIMALQEGEMLDARQLKRAIETYAQNLGLEGHKRIVVEHRKAGRQHFHIVFDLIHPVTGKQARLGWSKKTEWNTSRQLERMFNLKPVVSKGRAARQWECERGKRSGIDPIKMRKDVTALYKQAKTASAFIDLLDEAGFTLSVGKNSSFVLVDKAGDVHGLMRRIEGARLKDLKVKFGDFSDMQLPSASLLQKQRKPIRKITQPLQKSFVFKPLTLPRVSVNPAVKTLRALRHGSVSIGRFIGPAGGARKLRDELRALLQHAGALLSRRRKKDENKASIRIPSREEVERSELLAYAWDNGRLDILRMYGFTFPEPDEP